MFRNHIRGTGALHHFQDPCELCTSVEPTKQPHQTGNEEEEHQVWTKWDDEHADPHPSKENGYGQLAIHVAEKDPAYTKIEYRNQIEITNW